MYKYPAEQTVPDNSVWKQIQEFPIYWISNHGRVFNMRRGTLVSPYRNQHGVDAVRLYNGSRGMSRSISKLQRKAFRGPLEGKIVKFLMIETDGPWDTIFYMCGGCLHAVKLADVEEHARDEHKASGVELISKWRAEDAG